jgi:hypothetical protein
VGAQKIYSPNVVASASDVVAHNKNHIVDVRVLIDEELELRDRSRRRDARYLNNNGELSG